MRNLWSGCLGAAVVAVPAMYFLLQNDSPTSLAEQPVEPVRGLEQNADQAVRILELEARLSDMQTRMERAEAAAIGMVQRAAQNQPQHSENDSAPLPNEAVRSEQKSNTGSASDHSATSPEQQVLADQSYQQQVVSALENQLADEPHDAEWAGNFQSELEQGLTAESFSVTRLTNVDCKTSVCRVTLGHDSQEHEDQFFEHVLELPIMANTQAYYTRVPNPDGSSSMVMYIAREGKTLSLPARGAPNNVN